MRRKMAVSHDEDRGGLIQEFMTCALYSTAFFSRVNPANLFQPVMQAVVVIQALRQPLHAQCKQVHFAGMPQVFVRGLPAAHSERSAYRATWPIGAPRDLRFAGLPV
jgi:hypothetical protein